MALGRNSTFPLLVALVLAWEGTSTRNSTFPWWVKHILIRYNRVSRMMDLIVVLILCFVNNGRKLYPGLVLE